MEGMKQPTQDERDFYGLPIRYQHWIRHTIDLFNAVKKVRDEYPESKEWTDPIIETLRFIIYGESNEWIDGHFKRLVDNDEFGCCDKCTRPAVYKKVTSMGEIRLCEVHLEP